MTYGEIHDSIAGDQSVRFIDWQWCEIMGPTSNKYIHESWHKFKVWAMFVSVHDYPYCITIMLFVNRPLFGKVVDK